MSNPQSGASILFELPAKTLKGLYSIERALTGKTRRVARKRELSQAEFQNLLRQASLAETAVDSAAEIGHVTWGQLLAYLSILLLGDAKPWKRAFSWLGRRRTR